MVGKLNDMMAAAVVVDSTPKVNSSEAQSVFQPKPVDATVSSASAIKPKDASAPEVVKPGEDEKQEEHLKPGTMSEESVNQMTETFNKLMSKINVNIEFKYNKEIDMFNVKMIDKETKEVLKEFPPEEMIENMIKTRDWLGAFIDRTV